MTEQLPIFPLGMVAFPGMTVPLHIFEERYRAMVRHLLTIDDPAQRRFGIVAIREGYETGGHEARSMYRTGCVVQLGTVSEYDDGRYDLAAVGRERMRVVGTDASGPFLVAEVEVLPEEDRPSVDTAREAAHALATFADYRDLVSELRGDDVMTGTLAARPRAAVLRARLDLLADAARAPAAAGVADHPRAARAAAPPDAARDRRHERDPVPAGHRGGTVGLEPELARPPAVPPAPAPRPSVPRETSGRPRTRSCQRAGTRHGPAGSPREGTWPDRLSVRIVRSQVSPW